MSDHIHTNNNPSAVRIRMYRHGLGDCFLLRFPMATGGSFHLVIDSGVLKGTQKPTVIMREVAEDIARECGGTIDVLVVTHEHWDHVSGFLEAQSVWEQIRVNEIWLAWTEDPKNKLATKLRAERQAKKKAIKTKLAALAGGSSLRVDGESSRRMDALLGFLGLSLNAAGDNVSGTEAALTFIKQHAKKAIYQKPGTSFTRQEIPGVRIYVLGPPEDEKKIKRSDPSRAKPEVYSDPRHAFAFGTGGETDDLERPFGETVGRPTQDLRQYDGHFKQYFPTLLKDGSDPKWRRIDFESIRDLEQLALALDGDTNNTSLALAIELSDGRVLLFPADAQVGNWLSWQDHKWDQGNAAGPPVKADDLLARTVFYKVGHHGSHNATLKADGLEKMTHRDLIAVVPVNLTMARKKRWSMPFPPLYDRLREKTCGRVVLADALTPLPKANELVGVTAAERQRFRQCLSATPLFIDFNL